MNNWKPFKRNMGRLANGIMGGINSLFETVDEEIKLYKLEKKEFKEKEELVAKVLGTKLPRD